MRLYLVRHAIAEDAPEGNPFADPLRALTPKGRRRFRRSARRLRNLGEKVDAICTSPLLRAVQTAEMLGALLGLDEVRPLDELRPDAATGPLVARLRTLDARGVALVGHKRLLCELAALLTGMPLEESTHLRVRRGAILRIDVRSLATEPSGRPRWWIQPVSASVCEGLPLFG
jgi:phosphohistidine phosphatase